MQKVRNTTWFAYYHPGRVDLLFNKIAANNTELCLFVQVLTTTFVYRLFNWIFENARKKEEYFSCFNNFMALDYSIVIVLLFV